MSFDTALCGDWSTFWDNDSATETVAHKFPTDAVSSNVGIRSDNNEIRFIHIDEPKKKEKKRKSSWLDKKMRRHDKW